MSTGTWRHDQVQLCGDMDTHMSVTSRQNHHHHHHTTPTKRLSQMSLHAVKHVDKTWRWP